MEFNLKYKSINTKYKDGIYFNIGKDSMGELFIICTSVQKGKKRIVESEGWSFDAKYNEIKFVYFDDTGEINKQYSIEDCLLMFDVKEYNNSLYVTDRFEVELLKYDKK